MLLSIGFPSVSLSLLCCISLGLDPLCFVQAQEPDLASYIRGSHWMYFLAGIWREFDGADGSPLSLVDEVNNR
jgi:hypothetical protein